MSSWRMTPKHVFITGVTGCIGGSVFTLLKEAYPMFRFTALVRNPEHIDAVKAAGANPVLGSISDRTLVARLAEEADLVINCASLDDVEYSNAIIEGLKKRKESGNSVGIFIHVSGVAVFLDGSKEGKWVENGKIWSDANIDDVKAVTTHKNDKTELPLFVNDVDVNVVEASLRGYLYSYIIAPDGVYGLGTGPVGRVSGFIKYFGDIYIEKGHAFVVGEGTNVLVSVHVRDLARLYLLVVEQALAEYPPRSSPYERFFIAISGCPSWNTIAKAFGKGLHRLGRIPSAEVVRGDYDAHPIVAAFLKGNVFVRTERAQALGWVSSEPSFEDAVQKDLDAWFLQKS